MLASEPIAIGRRQLVHCRSQDPTSALLRYLNACDQAEQACFPATAWATNEQSFTLLQSQLCNGKQGLGLWSPRKLNVLQLKCGNCHGEKDGLLERTVAAF